MIANKNTHQNQEKEVSAREFDFLSRLIQLWLMSSSDWKTSETLWCPLSSGLWSALLETFKPVTKGKRKTEQILHINNVTFAVYITETLPRQAAVWGSIVCKWSNHHVKSCLLSRQSRFQLGSVYSPPLLLFGRLQENHTQLYGDIPERWEKVVITHCSSKEVESLRWL